MAISTRDALVTASQNAVHLQLYKNIVYAANTYYRYSTWGISGWPAAAATVAAGSVALNSSTLGAIPLQAATAAAPWYLTGHHQTATSGAYAHTLMDRLAHVGNINLASTAVQTVNLNTLPARASDVTGYGVYLEINSTNSAAITTCTTSYTNENGVSGRTGSFGSNASGVSGVPATGAASGNTTGPMTLQAGDNGARSVETIQFGSAGSAVTASLVMARTIDTITGPQYSIEARQGYADAGLVNLGADPCLYYVYTVSGTGSSPATISTQLTLVQG